ncbi:mechanosensitive ion channel family protein [Nonomuraea bangladeshensis]|uniref:mechanosensitive ion channel family protein n=1 Tax=Nonomuraea bangladeshensis TaxID=404385 RepID=UPI003384DAA6
MDINIGQGLTDAWRSIATFVPRLVAFVVILIIGYLIAKALEKVVDKILQRVGFDRAVERSGVRRWLERSKYDASSLLGRIVFYAIVLVTLQIAFSVFGPNPISALLTGVVAWLPRALVAIVIIVVAGAIAKAVRDILNGALGGLSYGGWIATAAAVFIWALGIIAALNQIGVATTVTTPVLITVLGTIGAILAIGIGGGLIRPMQQRWERWLSRMESEAPQARAHAEAYQRGRRDAAAMSGEETAPIGAAPGATAAGRPGTPQGGTSASQGGMSQPPGGTSAPPSGMSPPPGGMSPPPGGRPRPPGPHRSDMPPD